MFLTRLDPGGMRLGAKEASMASAASIKRELFEELKMNNSGKEIYEMTKLSDDEIYRTIGIAARDTRDSLKPGDDYLNSPNIGDNTGKYAFFFRSPKITQMKPALFLELPENDMDAGKVAYGQLEGQLGRVICETATNSSRFGYKQENIRLASQCAEAIRSRFPRLDSRIVMAFVALHAKNHFNACTMW
jgi:hypothetical protein